MAKANTKTENKASTEGFAVIKTGGKQYRVTVGSTINVEKLNGDFKPGDKVEFDQVLLTDNAGVTVLGTPTVAGAKVSAEFLEAGRAKKVIIYKYKQKNRSGTPKNGHRQPFSKVKITAIA